MKIKYYKEVDSLYLDLSSKKSVESREVSDGVVLDYDGEGNLVGIDVEHASEKLDMSTLVVDSLPARIESVSA
jgi:uncharacterized protein YuzE